MTMDRPRPKANTPLSSRELWTSAALGAAGVLLAYAAIYAGTGVHDGFGDWDLHRTGRRLRRLSFWLVPAAAVAAPFLRDSYHRMLEGRPRGWDILHAAARLFLHFGLWGMSVLLALTFRLCLFGLKRLAARLRLYGGEAKPFSPSWFAVPIWFIAFPFPLLGAPITDEDGGEVELPTPDRLSARRLLRWLPWLLAGMWFWTGAVSEDTGERVDPRWLFAAASYWFADFLIVARQVVPELKSSDQA